MNDEIELLELQSEAAQIRRENEKLQAEIQRVEDGTRRARFQYEVGEALRAAGCTKPESVALVAVPEMRELVDGSVGAEVDGRVYTLDSYVGYLRRDLPEFWEDPAGEAEPEEPCGHPRFPWKDAEDYAAHAERYRKMVDRGEVAGVGPAHPSFRKKKPKPAGESRFSWRVFENPEYYAEHADEIRADLDARKRFGGAPAGSPWAGTATET
jgi:hypothetical protein